MLGNDVDEPRLVKCSGTTMQIEPNVEVSRANEGANLAPQEACLRRASVATIGSAFSFSDEVHCLTERMIHGLAVENWLGGREFGAPCFHRLPLKRDPFRNRICFGFDLPESFDQRPDFAWVKIREFLLQTLLPGYPPIRSKFLEGP